MFRYSFKQTSKYAVIDVCSASHSGPIVPLHSFRMSDVRLSREKFDNLAHKHTTIRKM